MLRWSIGILLDQDLTTKIKMPVQSKISSFFNSPVAQKRSTAVDCGSTVSTPQPPQVEDKKLKKEDEPRQKKLKTDEYESSCAQTLNNIPHPIPKKLKTDDDCESCTLNNNSETNECTHSLSQEESNKVQRNKFAAKSKLLTTRTNGVVCGIGQSWFEALEPEFTKPYFSELCSYISSERKKVTVYPPLDQVFTWTRGCNIRDVNAVIIGQDPYHGPRQAHGLCFSVLPGVRPPPSLANIFKELTSSIDGFKQPGHGNLSGWSEQGVLLLNACLTVRASQANSHAGKGWEKFTDAVIRWINCNLNGVIFMLWGAYAQKKGAFIDKKRHHVLTSVHPSPLSAHRGFLGCKHFSRCNELLEINGKAKIDWSHLPQDVDL